MKAPYFHVDAFTHDLYAGNPAGICLLEEWLPARVMQRIAFENGLAETAFVVPEPKGEFGLRWFTPKIEVDLCGHATLAAAHVLAVHRNLPPPWKFHSQSGLLVVSSEEGRLVLDFPARPALPAEAPADLVAGLRVAPREVLRARDYMAVFARAEEVMNLVPDFHTLARLECLGIIATAPGDDCDFVSRFFAPRAGILEDPVTGSAHCTLVPFWAERLGLTGELHARQISLRGGELWCQWKGGRVFIGGEAVTHIEGMVSIADVKE